MSFKGGPAQALVAATIAFSAGLASVALFAPIAKRLRDDMELDPTALGFLIAVPSLAGSLLRIPFGAWADTVGGRLPNLVLLLTSILGVLGLAIVFSTGTPSVAVLSIFGTMAGAGIACFSVGIAMVGYWYPRERQGTTLGLYAGIGNTGPGLACLLVPLALEHFGIAGSYWLWVGALSLGTLIYFLIGRDAWYFQLCAAGLTPKEARAEAALQGQVLFPGGTMMANLKTSAGYLRTWIMVLVYFVSFGGFLGLTAWFPIFWQNLYGLDLMTAGLVTAIFSVGTSLVRAATGFMSDWLGGSVSALIGLALLTAGAFVLTFSVACGTSVLGMLVMAVGMGISNAAAFRILPEYLPGGIGGAAGWVGGLGALGGFFYPVVLSQFLAGGLAGDPGYHDGFAIFILSGGLGIVLLWSVRARNARVTALVNPPLG